MKTRLFLILGLAAVVVVAVPAYAVSPQAQSAVDCEHKYRSNFDHEPAVYAQETRTLARGSFSKLSLQAAHNGGISVEGWDQPDVSVTVCKAAGGSDAQQKLQNIRLAISGGTVTVEGPNADQWSAHLVVRVPAGIDMEMKAHNGPMSLRGVSGAVDAHTVNGPLSIKSCNGSIKAETTNGPVSVEGASGEIKVSAQNGPLSVRLSDQQWNGAGLDASTRNGPMTLTVPAGFRSGVEVVSEGRSPFSCRGCDQASRTWDEDGTKRARFGAGPVVVRMSTVNGPVTVRNQE